MSFFGEEEIINDIPRKHSAFALEDSQLLCLNKSEFFKVLFKFRVKFLLLGLSISRNLLI